MHLKPKLALLIIVLIIYNSVAIGQARTKILYNGKIFTANDELPMVQALAVRDGKIIAVGDTEPVVRAAGKNPEMIDLKGRCLLPGLIDSHNHAVTGGRSLLIAFLADTFLEEDSLAKYARYAIRSGLGMREDVLYIMGFHSNTWANIGMLNNIFNSTEYAQRAVALKGSDGHTAWVNKVMLKRAGITAAFIKSLAPNQQKYFGLTESGESNGLISESGFTYIDKVMPESRIQWNDALASGLRHLNSLGITAWMDPSAGSTDEGRTNGILTAYQQASKGKFSAHVAAVIRANGNADPAPQIKVARDWQTKFAGQNKITLIGFKIFADGVMEFPTQTASMSVPYKNSGLQGSQMVDPQKFKDFVVAADRAKLLVHIHAIGDRAVTDALNAVEAARITNKNKDLPHSITHLQCVNPKDLDRFASLNVPVSMQLLWATKDVYTEDLVKSYIDTVSYRYMYPARSILKRGGLVAGASDWSVSSPNPFEAIHMAETRVGKDGVLNPSEIMTRIDMLKAYTINAAKVILMDKSIGSINVGKEADFVLLDRDVMTVTPEEVKNTKVVWTMVGGEKVYESEKLKTKN